MVFVAVRMFLRYLAVDGKCRAGLEHALTPIAHWSQPPGNGDDIGGEARLDEASRLERLGARISVHGLR